MRAALAFQPRFVKPEDLPALSDLWHLSRAATGGTDRWKRLHWTCKAFHEAHAYVSETGVYKDLTDMLREGGR